MKIDFIQNNSTNAAKTYKNRVSFQSGGKPITLQYILQNRTNLLPPRILEQVKNTVRRVSSCEMPSLLELHKKTYSPLLACKTLDEVKQLYPEFSEIKEDVVFLRDSVYAKEFKAKTDKNFVLKLLQEYWVQLKTKDEIARELGMNSRSSLEWALKQIGFVSYPHNYKTLLKASDKIGNDEIAAKTRAWNKAHPDEMYARNKHAAQGCKTPEYRAAQSQRIRKYDAEHPERKEKISQSLTYAWEICPELRSAMLAMLAENRYTGIIFSKKRQGIKLTDSQHRMIQGFFKRYWDSHPEFKTIFSQACKKSK